MIHYLFQSSTSHGHDVRFLFKTITPLHSNKYLLTTVLCLSNRSQSSALETLDLSKLELKSTEQTDQAIKCDFMCKGNTNLKLMRSVASATDRTTTFSDEHTLARLTNPDGYLKRDASLMRLMNHLRRALNFRLLTTNGETDTAAEQSNHLCEKSHGSVALPMRGDSLC